MPPNTAPIRAAAAPQGSGFLHSAVAGRTDHLKTNVPSGGYVIPADLVSGIGEGNSLAGARILHAEFGDDDGPAKSTGGEKSVPILGAGGEFIVSPRALERKFGNVQHGHKVLDRWVVSERKRIAKEILKLPGPVKN